MAMLGAGTVAEVRREFLVSNPSPASS